MFDADSAVPEIDDSFIMISKNYLDEVHIEIDEKFADPVEPKIIENFPFDALRMLADQEADTHAANLNRLHKNKPLYDQIFSVLESRRYRAGSTGETRFGENKELFRSAIENAIKANKPIQFVLPSFPFKCPNPAKVRRRSPAMAEVLCLARLYEICEVISRIYPPGAEFIIIADGLVYKDMFGASGYEANRYRDLSQRYIDKMGFSGRLKIVDMQALIAKDSVKYKLFREKLLPLFSRWWDHHKTGDRVRSLIDACMANVVSDSHVTQDLVRLGTSRAFVEVEDKKIARIVNQIRSKVKVRAEKCAFDYAFFLHVLREMKLVGTYYPDAIRCTVHPKPRQWGIHLVNEKSTIFPWHGVAVYTEKGWRVHYEYALVTEEYRPVNLLDDCYPFFYEKVDCPFEITNLLRKD